MSCMLTYLLQCEFECVCVCACMHACCVHARACLRARVCAPVATSAHNVVSFKLLRKTKLVLDRGESLKFELPQRKLDRHQKCLANIDWNETIKRKSVEVVGAKMSSSVGTLYLNFQKAFYKILHCRPIDDGRGK